MTLGGVLAGLLLGAVPAAVAWAPASLMVHAVHKASAGHVLLADAEGTLWKGNALMALTNGSDHQDATALPGRLNWRLGLHQGLPALWLQQACCINGPLLLQWRPGLDQQRIAVRGGGTAGPGSTSAISTGASWGQWPISVLAGLGAPWNTLRPSGRMQLSSQQLDVQLVKGQLVFQGQLELVLSSVASRVSTLDNLGDYRLHLQAVPGGGATVQLQTLRGALQLNGSGQWLPEGLRFSGQASAAPGSEAALNNLLNIIGRREGAVSLFSIGQT